ncbi:MAG: cation-transporting P-type ATPase [Candidatus Diapherotrites archaeon]|nr:cation-transporting P-type ATPase [Candidatus Diapherotrites archaeon]
MDWHSMSASDVLKALKTSSSGLTESEVERRLCQYGKNLIESEYKINPIKIFLKQFTDYLILILIAAAVVSFIMSLLPGGEGHEIDAILIAIILIANATIGFFQEYKAEKSILALKKLAAPNAVVLREGFEKIVPAELIVPGDIIVLEAGSKVPADARIIEHVNLQVDESMLTGESMPVSKDLEALPEETVLAERANMLYMNTFIISGKAKAVVVAIGKETEIGKIAKMLSEVKERPTPFQVEVDKLGKAIGLGVIAIISFVAVLQFAVINDTPFEIFLRSVSLAVAAVPEGLPVVVSVVLTLGIRKMAKKRALARKLPVAESLGSVNVICTDKTGTLTENKMTVRKIYFNGHTYDVTGTGYDEKGHYSGDKAIDENELRPLLLCGVLCNDAKEHVFQDKKEYFGDPTEIALLIAAKKGHIEPAVENSKNTRIYEVPFTSERKMMSVVCKSNNELVVYTKGAPEILLEHCSHVFINGKEVKMTTEIKEKIINENKEMAKNALRVLAFATKKISALDLNEKTIEKNLVFLGLQGMIDPPRAGVKEALEDCRRAGIKVIMVTGDNLDTAIAIGKELGFNVKNATSSKDLENMGDEELKSKIDSVEIFARVTPIQKVRIVDALHAKNYIVAMTGDGANDALALKKADVGISMGIRGTDVAKEVSDLVLLDDNFVTIRDAVEEGRAIFDNIKKFVTYMLSANLGEVLVVFFFTIMQLFHSFGDNVAILTAAQLLWINMLTDSMPAIALGLDPAAKNIMERKPRKAEEGVIDQKVLFSIISIGLIMSVIILLTFMYAFLYSTDKTNRFLRAQTIAFTSVVVFELVRANIVRANYKINILANKWLWASLIFAMILQFIILYTPLNTVFKIVPLSFYDWLLILVSTIIFTAIMFLVTKAEKIIFVGE